MHASKNAENQANMVKFKNEFKPLLRQKYPKSRRECLDDKSGTGGQAVVEMPVLKNRQKLSQGTDFWTCFCIFERRNLKTEKAIVLSGNKQTREMSEEERSKHEAAIEAARAKSRVKTEFS